ncbi:unnamed protein product [Taenia asiatica]|uniref:Secreted protein n=1 Tax=Taenia asiatica TaxID=60517 RepID=A0A0R3WH84_TAEAS|nr:unnamed protein product [Taenia asiatica]
MSGMQMLPLTWWCLLALLKSWAPMLMVLLPWLLSRCLSLRLSKLVRPQLVGVIWRVQTQ